MRSNPLVPQRVESSACGTGLLRRVPLLAMTALSLSLISTSYLLSPNTAQAAEAPVSFDAQQLLYDDEDEVVTAIGDVRLEQEGRVLQADSILYKIKEDKVTAVGNVILTEVDGSVYTADKVQLRERFQQGYVSYLKGALPDGGRFSSSYAERRQEEDGDEIIMRDATYTSCAPCEKDPEADPAWQIRAQRVTHERDEKRVSYNNATLELGGVPVLYTPYFSHPDGTEDQKSGLVEPVLGFDSELGAYGGASYYYAIAPDKDATIGLTAYSRETPVANLEYRQRFEDAEIELGGTTTYSNRVINAGGTDIELEDEWRGNVEASGLWDINQKWRAGFDINLTSDDQYLRQYDLSEEDILENQLYVERFSGRNYADARLIGFQDTRVINEQTDSPDILPEVSLSFLGDPGDTIGGRWSFDFSALSLQRDGSDPDTNRMSAEIGWQGHRKMDIGLVSTLDVNARGDYYYLTDQTLGDRDFDETRGNISANLETSYPLIRPVGDKGSNIVLEPVVSLTAATQINDQNEISNEDSQDSQVDVNNLFDDNRFTGYDRIEDTSRVTYGLRGTYYSAGDLELGAFAGQSYNFEDRTTFFQNGSGLNEQGSDYVAELNARYGGALDLNYRTRLDRNSFASRAHEVDMRYEGDRLELGGLYFFSKGIQGTDFAETREQLRGSGRVRMSDHWYSSAGLAYDLGVDPGLREADFGIEYVGECFSVGTFLQRDLTDDNSGDADTQISIRIGLKTLGNFEASSTILSDEDE